MFAYCGNNPVCNTDATGTHYVREGTFGGLGGPVGSSGGGGGGNNGTTFSYALWPTNWPNIAQTVVAAGATIIVFTVADQREEQFLIRAWQQEQAKFESKEPKRHNHHIVAKADKRAEESRQILRDVGINPLIDPRNLVLVPQEYHQAMHTTKYHNHVTACLRPVAGNRAGVETVLAMLAVEILLCSALGVRWD